MADPRSLGFSPDRLARLDRFITEKYLQTGRMPCAQVVISRHGEIVHEFVGGKRDLARGLASEADTIFRIYSMTKPITSIAFMMLVEEGKVALDDPVHRFIPEWANLGVFSAGVTGGFLTRPVARPMQMVDLLRHTSGLTYGFQNRTNVDAAYRKAGVGEIGSTLPLDDMIATLGTLPLEFSPGEAWNYSVSTDVLGYLVGKISGIPFEQFLQERIFSPLGMTDTGFQVRDGQGGRFASCYNATPKGGLDLQDDATKSDYLRPPSLVSGGGGLVSTAADYMKFCQMLLDRGACGEHHLIAPKTLDLMTVNHLPDGKDLTQLSRSLFSEATNAGVGFGLGFAVVQDAPRTLVPCSDGEFYWGGAASTAFWVDPAEDLSVVFMTQVLPSSAYPIRRELRTLVYSALVEPDA
ncbi:serine hydrolase [Phenylobacterium sp. Root77]|uniref:serine hydrolase domain-containing protein n=1 Tax=unclassified Phenylobacterium TaxID=2640670 RepID=UPI0006F52D80|nr:MULTISPECIES: serine hydrolase domain-containing protein [unclassified Phenylobacterium]KQW71591.1 serine hydrolase [Phenylobacterium sp. Root1277]KQW94511.1 serine hydrolase [Phenylobacterium sp. Root1290]KRC44205.1 serine hydrolase [Phenylobacterium sp. Root77]